MTTPEPPLPPDRLAPEFLPPPPLPVFAVPAVPIAPPPPEPAEPPPE